MLKTAFLALACLFFSASLQALPSQVILVRHAEKPQVGVTLSSKGQKRAAAFAPYFIENFGIPTVIFAQAPINLYSSMRPIETMTPLATTLKMELNTSYNRDQFEDCAQEILTNEAYSGKTVLCCFEHDTVAELAHKLGIKSKPKWPNSVFDWVWIITFDKNGKATLQQNPQKLLYGDSTKVN